MEGYRITMIQTDKETFRLEKGIRSIEPLVEGVTTVDRAYVVTKHDRSVIWHVYDVETVKYEKT